MGKFRKMSKQEEVPSVKTFLGRVFSMHEVRRLKDVVSKRASNLLDILSEEDGSCDLSKYTYSDLIAMGNVGRGTVDSLETGIASLREAEESYYIDIDLRDISYIKSITPSRVHTLLDNLIEAYPLREGLLCLSELSRNDLYGIKKCW